MNQKSMVFMGMGFELAGLAFGATYLGKYVDNYFHWQSMWGTMFLVLSSLVLWFFHIFVLLKQLEKNDPE
jgi:hypothetical protein